jgi:hypothetical protein
MLTAKDARAYLLLAAQSTLGNQAINDVTDHRLSSRGVQALTDRDAQALAKKVRAWLESTHPTLFNT